MKNRRSFIIALPLILAMLFVSLAPFVAVPAKAITLDSNSTGQTIYYFSDYYPTIDQETMAEYEPDCQTVYYHQWVNETTLVNEVMQGFPVEVEADVFMVIIDIKSFKPSGNALGTIFATFAAMGYKTVFVTPYDQAEFDSLSFLNNVDVYYQTNFTILKCFIRWSLNSMYTHNNNTLSNTTILIDGRLVDPFYGDTADLAERFPFYRILKEELAKPPYHTATNVRLLVHGGSNSSGNSFYDLSSDPIGNSYTVSDIADFTDADENCIWEHICAMGFWELEDDFYDFIKDNQESHGDMPVYLLQVDPPVYGEDGVAAFMFTVADARAMAGENPEEPFETDALLAAIAPLFD